MKSLLEKTVSAVLTNTVGLARCSASEWGFSRFNGFRMARGKAVETAESILNCFHRAKATVLMRNFQ